MPDHFKHFRDNLKTICVAYGSQKQFAEQLGITTVHMCNVISGKSMPSTKLLMQIADEAGWTLSQLLESTT